MNLNTEIIAGNTLGDILFICGAWLTTFLGIYLFNLYVNKEKQKEVKGE